MVGDMIQTNSSREVFGLTNYMYYQNVNFLNSHEFLSWPKKPKQWQMDLKTPLPLSVWLVLTLTVCILWASFSCCKHIIVSGTYLRVDTPLQGSSYSETWEKLSPFRLKLFPLRSCFFFFKCTCKGNDERWLDNFP